MAGLYKGTSPSMKGGKVYSSKGKNALPKMPKTKMPKVKVPKIKVAKAGGRGKVAKLKI